MPLVLTTRTVATSAKCSLRPVAGRRWQFSLPRDERCGVPTQKPVALCEQVINLMSRKGDIVLDPFAGSGSIPLAARNLGRRYIGIECDLKTFRIMKNRMNGARR